MRIFRTRMRPSPFYLRWYSDIVEENGERAIIVLQVFVQVLDRKHHGFHHALMLVRPLFPELAFEMESFE